MSKKIKISFLLLSTVFSLLLFSDSAEANNPRRYNERFVIKALQTIHSAQATYSATAGNGDYGSNLDLREAGFIDSVLADGNKYGYYFMFFSSRHTATAPTRFYVTATPQRYNKTGKISFYIDESGEIHGADKGGWLATNTDPIIDWCAEYEYEKCTIAALRNIHGAQMTYQSTVGNGSDFGTLSQLYTAGLIGQRIGNGLNHGYRFTITTAARTSTTAAFFKVSAVPDRYGVTGTRSFYISVDGVMRGADKNGESANENDPPIDY